MLCHYWATQLTTSYMTKPRYTISSWEVWSYLQTPFKPFGSCLLASGFCSHSPPASMILAMGLLLLSLSWLPWLASKTACKLASSSWSLQNSGVMGSLWRLHLCTTSLIPQPISYRHLKQNALTYGIWGDSHGASRTTSGSGLVKCYVKHGPHPQFEQHLIMSPPFPNTLKRLTRLKKLKDCLFQLDLLQLQIKTKLKEKST